MADALPPDADIAVGFRPKFKGSATGTATVFIASEPCFPDELRITDADARKKYVADLIKFKRVLKPYTQQIREKLEAQAVIIIKQLQEIDAKTPQASGGEPVDDRGNGFIQWNERQLPEIAGEAMGALMAGNEPTPCIFSYGGNIARLKTKRDQITLAETVVSEILNPTAMVHELGRVAKWKEKTPRGFIDGAPPSFVAKDLLAWSQNPLPSLRGIIQAPVFSRSGNLILQPGYDRESGLWHDCRIGTIPTVPENPTDEEIAQAKAFILEPLADFPFVSQADRTHAIVVMLLPFMREMIDGYLPFFTFDAPTPGTGKDLLSITCLYPFLGYELGTTTAPQDKDEWRKQITSHLMAGGPVCFFGNVDRKIDSAYLAQVLTCTTFEDRELGVSRKLCLPNRSIWGATGNKIECTPEINRRRVPTNLDAGLPNPESRQNFKIKNLQRWSHQNRERQVWAALVVIQRWIAAGKPLGNVQMGSYVSFSEIMGGLMEVAGLPDFLGNWNSSELGKWVAAECVCDRDAKTPMREIIDSYDAWRKSRKLLKVNEKDFFSELEKTVPVIAKSFVWVDGHSVKAYAGIRLKCGSEEVTATDAQKSSTAHTNEITPENGSGRGATHSADNELSASSTASTGFPPFIHTRARAHAHARTHTPEGGQTPVEAVEPVEERPPTDEHASHFTDVPDGLDVGGFEEGEV